MTDIPDPRFSQARRRDLRPDAVVSIALRDGIAGFDETIGGQAGIDTPEKFLAGTLRIIKLLIESIYQLEDPSLIRR